MLKKVNQKIESNIIVIYMIYLFLQPILDLTTGILLNKFNLDLSISAYIRMLFLLFGVYYLWFINQERNKKYLIVLLFYSIFFLSGIYIFKGMNMFLFESKMLLNILYFPIILLFTIRIFNYKKISLKKISIILEIYLILIFVPNLLNIGFNSYSYAKTGAIGFFYSANAVGSIISLLIGGAIAYMQKCKNRVRLLILLIVYVYCLLNIGTKAPLLCASLIFIYYLIYLFYYLIKTRKYILFIILIGLLSVFIIAFIILIPKTPFYQNIIIHLNFLEIHSFKDFFSFKCLDRFIFSDRLTFFENNLEIYQNANIYQKLFGIGYTINNSYLKIVEMDYLDMIISQGIIGFIIIYFLYFKILYKIFRNYFKNFKNNFNNLIKSSCFIAVIISILCACLTGHVLSTPAVAIYVIIILVLTNKIMEE